MTEIDRRPRTLTVHGAAEYSGIAVDTLRKLVYANKVAAKKNGTKTLIIRESLDLYLDSLPSA